MSEGAVASDQPEREDWTLLPGFDIVEIMTEPAEGHPFADYATNNMLTVWGQAAAGKPMRPIFLVKPDNASEGDRFYRLSFRGHLDQSTFETPFRISTTGQPGLAKLVQVNPAETGGSPDSDAQVLVTITLRVAAGQ